MTVRIEKDPERSLEEQLNKNSNAYNFQVIYNRATGQLTILGFPKKVYWLFRWLFYKKAVRRVVRGRGDFITNNLEFATALDAAFTTAKLHYFQVVYSRYCR